jgi:Predicted DNA-binding proteins
MEPDEEIAPVECRRRGRPRVRRIIEGSADARCYEPRCCPEKDGAIVTLTPEEIELLRLIDIEGLEQEEAAARLGVSRKTAWRDLHDTRKKITDALVNGKGIEMTGCRRAAEGRCPCCPRAREPDTGNQP